MSGLAIVGASERTIWTEWLTRTLDQFGYPEPVFLVNPRYQEVLGRPCHPSVAALPERPSVVLLCISATQSLAQLEGLLELGVEEVVVIANGFGETGTAEGRAREAELRATCAGSSTRVIGPNCIGFARFHERLCAIAQPVPANVRAGDVSVISQSGGLSGGVLGALASEGLGIDLCYSIGNGVCFGVEQALEWAVSRETTRTVCGIVESIRDPERFERSVAAARSAGKEIILVTLGTSRQGHQAAASHTGATIGEQRLLGAYLERLGVLVAADTKEQARMAALLRVVGRPDPARGVFVITASGGGAALTADAAERHGVPLARLSPGATEAVRELIPPGPYIGNPLDVTAGNGPGGVRPVYDVVCREPSVGLLVEPYVLPWPTHQEANRWHRDALERVVDAGAARDLPLLVVSVFEQQLSDWAVEFGAHPRVGLSAGLELTMAALGKLFTAHGTALPEAAARRNGAAPAGQTVLGEAESRAILGDAGFTLPRGQLAASEDDAVAVAATLTAPLVVKLALPGVGHKGRVGGVQVGVVGEKAVRAACRAVAAGAIAAGLAEDGAAVPVLVCEMAFGPELLVGAIRDPVAGPTLTVGFGGWAAESGRSFGTVALPLASGQAGALIERWGLAPLLGAARAAALGRLLSSLAEAVTAGPLEAYGTVELNPVILTGDAAVAADVLLVR